MGMRLLSDVADSCAATRFVQGRERREVERESEWKKSSENRESPVGEESGRAIGNAPHQEGRAGSAMPLHVAKVRSGNRGPEGVTDERARKPGSTAGEGRGSGGTDYAVETVGAEGGKNELDPHASQSDAKSRW